jgi:hypothetical protein
LLDFVLGAALPSADGETTDPHYIAFLASSSDPEAIQLVDLGDAESIDPILVAQCAQTRHVPDDDGESGWPTWSNAFAHLSTVH